MKRASAITLLVAGFAAAAFSADPAPTVPRPAPDFTIEMPGGKKVFTSQYKGKVMVMAFISTTCPHCQKLTGLLSGINKDYAPKGVQVLESAFNDGAMGLLPDFLKTFKPTFPMGYNDRTAVFPFLQIPLMSSGGYVPKLVFIDRKGVIRAQYAGEDKFMLDAVLEKNIRAKLDELVKEPVPAARKGPSKRK